MNLRPFTIARYGVWSALGAAAISVWLGNKAGATFDFTLMRAVFVFVLFAALGFGADAVLTLGTQPPATPAEPPPAMEHDDE